MEQQAALVLFSGGQDSTTCLGWALDRYVRVETVGFRYGQRHAVELECRQRVLAKLREQRPDWSAKLAEDHMIDVTGLAAISQTALTGEVEISMGANGLPTTFVPGRNILFLTYAAALGYRRGTRHLVTGVCETDYSGYPDCRDDAIKATQLALNLGMDSRFVIHTPLMWLDKAQTWQLAAELGGEPLLELIREETHSCYLGDRSQRFDWGYGCGSCPACELRAAGWQRYRAQRP